MVIGEMGKEGSTDESTHHQIPDDCAAVLQFDRDTSFGMSWSMMDTAMYTEAAQVVEIVYMQIRFEGRKR